jgi:hypothetical protein
VVCAIFALTGCGASKKNLAITKSDTKEKKDLTVFEQREEVGVVEFTRDATEMIVEPKDPSKPLIVNNDTIIGAKKVTYKKEKVDSTATVAKNETVKTIDNGTVHETKKERNRNLEREGFGWKGLKTALIWIAIVIVVGGIVYLRKSGKRIF